MKWSFCCSLLQCQMLIDMIFNYHVRLKCTACWHQRCVDANVMSLSICICRSLCPQLSNDRRPRTSMGDWYAVFPSVMSAMYSFYHAIMRSTLSISLINNSTTVVTSNTAQSCYVIQKSKLKIVIHWVCAWADMSATESTVASMSVCGCRKKLTVLFSSAYLWLVPCCWNCLLSVFLCFHAQVTTSFYPNVHNSYGTSPYGVVCQSHRVPSVISGTSGHQSTTLMSCIWWQGVTSYQCSIVTLHLDGTTVDK